MFYDFSMCDLFHNKKVNNKAIAFKINCKP